MKSITLLLIGVLSICASSCTNIVSDNSSQEATTYSIYRNFSGTIPKATTLAAGEAIIGVLLKYTSEGPYNSDVKPVNEHTFAIYCLYDKHGVNGDGMKFNYVLYVPKHIKDEFTKAGGPNPNSGDPFWWYMRKYFNWSMTMVQGDWITVINKLCTENTLPKAKASDYSPNAGTAQPTDKYTTWTENIGSSCTITTIEAFLDGKDSSFLVLQYNYTATETMNTAVFNPPNGDKFKFFGSPVTVGSGTIAFRIPVSLIVEKQAITTVLSVTDSNRIFAGITLTGIPSNLKTAFISSTAVIVNPAVVSASNNAGLSALTVSTGTLSPIFETETTAYTVSVPNDTTSILVTGIKSDPNATISANSGVGQSLIVGSNTITITVTAQDGTTIKNYVVTVLRWGTDILSANIGTLKYVPAGRFQRNSTSSNISVISKPYRMSQREITREQFLSIIGSDPSNTTFSSGNTDPVQMVNWYHAIAFCNKLSLAEGLDPVYTVSGVDFNSLTAAEIPTIHNVSWSSAAADWNANGYRLPTLIEGMWAAMGAPADGQGSGTNTTEYLKTFAGSTGSNSIGDYVWYDVNSSSKTHPVGTKYVNELGLYDMSGNVNEWCWDWQGVLPNGIQTDYRGADSGTFRTYRGGGWMSSESWCTVADQHGDYPYFQHINFGFRVVRP